MEFYIVYERGQNVVDNNANANSNTLKMCLVSTMYTTMKRRRSLAEILYIMTNHFQYPLLADTA